MNYIVPFVPNTDDGLHCFQSSLLMIAKFFKPDFNIAWSEWSDITGYEEGKGTWASAGLLWFIQNGFEVRHISLFDYAAFIESGGDYLTSEYGAKVAEWQIEHSNLPLEQERSKKLLATNIVEYREPTIEDILRFLDEGWLVRCLVNSRRLNRKDGYFGHSIIVSGYEGDNIIIQDPGLPPVKNRKVSFADFENAWADPNTSAKELDAYKLPVKT